MPITNVKFKDNRCFTDEWCGFEAFLTVNVIIGRNNTGKSLLLDLVRTLCNGTRAAREDSLQVVCAGAFDTPELQPIFQPNNSGGDLQHNHWNDHGAHFVGLPLKWTLSRGNEVSNLKLLNPDEFRGRYGMQEPVMRRLELAASRLKFPFEGKKFRHLLADRDIRREAPRASLTLGPDGDGATDIIRKYYTSVTDIGARKRKLNDLLVAFNQIFGPDGNFIAIKAHLHDDGGREDGKWEVFWEEPDKGLVPLGNSGSGLKTILLVLLNLLIVPDIEKVSASNYVFAFEELENNLHPALLRRLLRYVESFALESGCTIFLTTHSSATLDLFSRVDHAQFVRVSHNGRYASTQTIDKHFDKAGLVGELGTKASDILQANGIVWVEGPSDAIYLNHWIGLASGGELIEGRDYTCAFYGGSLLARTHFSSPDEVNLELVNLIPLNRNAALICDSDKTSPRMPLKARVTKAKEALSHVADSTIWISAGKEIETYLPGIVVGAALGKSGIRDPERYELIFPSTSKDKKGGSYVEKALGQSSIDKIELALKCREHMTLENLSTRLDWKPRIDDLIATIRKWNA